MITCWPSLYRPREGRLATDRALLARVREPLTYADKDDVPRWAGAEFFAGYRSIGAWLRSSWLVFDFDHFLTRETIESAFGDLCGFAYTTWTAGRWRCAVKPDRNLETLDEHERCWRASAARAERFGLTPDYVAKDASRAWALPARHGGNVYEHIEFTGGLFDVKEALTRFPTPEPLPEPTRADRTDSYDRRIERARLYLAKMDGAIAGSGGHRATFHAACVLVRGFSLEPADALRILVEDFNPRCVPPWSVAELRHKCKQAHQRARMPFGALADRPLERRAG